MLLARCIEHYEPSHVAAIEAYESARVFGAELVVMDQPSQLIGVGIAAARK